MRFLDWVYEAFEDPKVKLKQFQPVEGIKTGLLLPNSINLIIIVGLALPPSRLRVWLLVPACLAISTYLVLLCGSDAQPTEALNRSTMSQPVALRAVELLAVHLAEKDYRRADGRPTPPEWTWDKVKWAAALWFTPRKIGWNARPKTVPPSSGAPRGRWLLSKLARMVADFLVFNALVAFHTYNPFMLTGANYPKSQLHILHRTYPLTMGICGYLSMEILYDIMAVVAVGTFLSKPADWPDWFGSFTAVRSVGAFWGQFWHQALRHSFLAVAQVLEPWRMGLNRRHFTVLVAFFCSAFVHMGQAWALCRRYRGTFTFFCLQPLALYIEEALSPRLKRVFPRWLGYVWTLAWFWATSALMWDEVVDVATEKMGGGLPIFPTSRAFRRGHGLL